MDEMRNLIEEIKKCGEVLVKVADSILNSETAEKQPEKKITLEDVRAVLTEKSRAGFNKEVKELIGRYGVEKLSDIDEADFKTVLAEAEAIK